jgi:hypothetical protein
MPRYEPATVRIWRKVAKGGPDECWEWLGSKTAKGYGQFYGEGRISFMAYRYMYGMLVGPIPDGYHIDHLCRNPRCVNPCHLEAVTPYENNRRSESITAKKARQTHCVNGHELTDENTYVRIDGKGRECRACRANRKRGLPPFHSQSLQPDDTGS